MIMMRKYSRVLALVAGIFWLAIGSASAAPFTVSFNGVVNNGVYDAWGNLIGAGDQVSGTVGFDFSPPNPRNVDGPITGGFTFNGYTVQLTNFDQINYGDDFAIIGLHGSENLPSADTMGPTVYRTAVVDGLFIRFNGINGITATLDDYVAWNDISIFLSGYAYNSDTQQSFDGIFTQIDLTGSTITAEPVNSAPVPEPATMLLLCSGLVGLAVFRKQMKK